MPADTCESKNVASAEQIKKDKARDQEQQTYGGDYQELAFDQNGFEIARGRGMEGV